MRPIILKGHTRPLTCVKYNRDGDLLFSSSKDNVPTVWRTEDGKRLGTYDGHKGTVWHLDATSDSKYLLTGGADMTVKMWEVQTGKMLHEIAMPGPVRQVEWAEGNKFFFAHCDPFRGSRSQLKIFDVDYDDMAKAPVERTVWVGLGVPAGKKVNKATWMPLNKCILLGDEFGKIRVYDVATGKIVADFAAHKKKINSLQWNKEKTLLVTGSADCTSKVFDVSDFSHLKTYQTQVPVNSAAISPIKEHVLVAGGQEAMNVTTTSARAGKFETKFFHLVFEEEFGSVKGHFGPVNSLAIHPDGTG